jgi:hypothetical protein
MKSVNGRYSFLERHPEAFLVPSAALFAFLAYLNLAKLASSRASVGADWLASAILGCACAIALLAALVIRLRAGRAAMSYLIPPVLVVAGLVVDKREIWAVPNPPGLVTTAFQNGTLALCGTLGIGIVAMLGWFYLATVDNQKMARKSARVPVRDLHISRASDWRQSDASPIDRGEWERYAASHPVLSHYDLHGHEGREDAITHLMAETGVSRDRAADVLRDREQSMREERARIESRPDLLAKHPEAARVAHIGSSPASPVFALERADGTRLLLQWRRSQLTALRVSPDQASDTTLILPIAQAFGAHVYDEPGTLIA